VSWCTPCRGLGRSQLGLLSPSSTLTHVPPQHRGSPSCTVGVSCRCFVMGYCGIFVFGGHHTPSIWTPPLYRVISCVIGIACDPPLPPHTCPSFSSPISSSAIAASLHQSTPLLPLSKLYTRRWSLICPS
jgi:hypothetical protein